MLQIQKKSSIALKRHITLFADVLDLIFSSELNMWSSLCNVVPRVRRHLSRQYRIEGRHVCCRCRLPDIFTALKKQWKKSWTRPFPHESLSQNIVKWAFVFSNKQIRGCFGESLTPSVLSTLHTSVTLILAHYQGKAKGLTRRKH